jgi:hypothetical protein
MLVHVQKGKESLQHCSIAGMYAYEGHQHGSASVDNPAFEADNLDAVILSVW